FSKKCLLVLNSDLIKDKSQIKADKMISLPLNKIALECGTIKCANVVALGALLKLKPGILKQSTIIEILKEVFSNNKELLEQNTKALHEGQMRQQIFKP
ncbi:MAG: 2-oxoacid:acceptor oxidoreductase family protein, partial [Candidatus Omnitrophota bacterium]